VATVVAAFNLRIALAGVGPVVEDIRADTGLSSALAGLLTTVPILCMGALAVGGPPVIARIGITHTITACLVLIAGGTLARAAAPTGATLILATFPIGVGLALAGIALPPLVKENFPQRGGLVTGAYAASMTIAAALFSMTVIPISDALGGWREAFAASAIVAAVALPIWLVASRGARARIPVPAARAGNARLGVVLALLFGLQAVPFSSMLSWVAAIYRDAGWDPGDAALTTGLLLAFAVPSAIAIPGLSDGRDRRRWIAGTAALVAAGIAGVAFAPEAAPVLWLILFGVGNGALFPLVLTLPVDFGRSREEVARLAVWTLGGGYVISATGPVTVGALRDLSGGFELPMAIVAAFAAGAGVMALTVLPEPRHGDLPRTGE
jgi:MFS transporter, CP family, cyanate transporter